VCLFAGQIAEKKFANRTHGQWSDDHEAIDLAMRIFSSKAVLEPYLRFAFARSADLVGRDWTAIEAIAAALSERQRLSYAEADDVIKRALRPPRRSDT
jgi:hypothetical protein